MKKDPYRVQSRSNALSPYRNCHEEFDIACTKSKTTLTGKDLRRGAASEADWFDRKSREKPFGFSPAPSEYSRAPDVHG
jgi:hypothetical protein